MPGILVTSQHARDERSSASGRIPEADKVIVKPAQGGSSIDVHVVTDRSAGALLEGVVSRYGRAVIRIDQLSR